MNFLRIFLVLAGFFWAEALALDSEKPSSAVIVTVEKASTRPACCRKRLGAKNAAVFMTLTTPVGQKDVLLGGKCAASERVELHTHKQEKGIMKMRPVDVMEIEGTRLLKPGSDHVMLMGLKKSLKVGETIQLTLQFKESGDITVPVVVETAGGGKHGPCDPKLP